MAKSCMTIKNTINARKPRVKRFFSKKGERRSICQECRNRMVNIGRTDGFAGPKIVYFQRGAALGSVVSLWQQGRSFELFKIPFVSNPEFTIFKQLSDNTLPVIFRFAELFFDYG